MDLGIATIYQELDLVEGLTVAENIYLGHEKSRFGFSRRAEASRATAALLARLGHPEISPSAEVGSLSAAGQQIVSMARALSRDARLIVMDEPSAVLDSGEVQRLFKVIRDLTAEGVAVIYISHRLEEIRTIGDRVTVLKDGATVATGLQARDTPTAEIIRLMTGRVHRVRLPAATRGRRPPSRCCRSRASPARASSRTSASTCGPARSSGWPASSAPAAPRSSRPSSAPARPTGAPCRSPVAPLRPGSVDAAVRAGVGLCPEERKSQALLLGDSVARNISLASLARFGRAGFLGSDGERRAAEEQVKALDVRPGEGRRARCAPSPAATSRRSSWPGGCSGGARSSCSTSPRAAWTSAPAPRSTPWCARLADSGVAVVVVSSEIEEVLGLSDRVLVIGEGSVLHEGPSTEIDEHGVLDIIMRGDAA